MEHSTSFALGTVFTTSSRKEEEELLKTLNAGIMKEGEGSDN